MDLKALHAQVKQAISTLDLERIWPGFTALRFALYDEQHCCFDGAYVEKTDAFCANTSIVYQGEQIAIWMVQEEPELSVLSSKLVHEMFHGYQSLMGWDCWPNELEALYRYAYNAENLSLKLRENELLLTLLERFDDSAFRELLAHRKRRSLCFPYEFSYESRVEEIEGTANYVEWQVLKQLDARKAEALTERMRERMTKPDALLPIRISCYASGALMLHALRCSGAYSFSAATRPVLCASLEQVLPSEGDFSGRELRLAETEQTLQAFREETEAIIRAALTANEPVLTGPLMLTGLNIYNARRWQEYLTSSYFLMYRAGGEDRLLQGNFVIKMRDERTIDAVYRQAERPSV